MKTKSKPSKKTASKRAPAKNAKPAKAKAPDMERARGYITTALGLMAGDVGQGIPATIKERRLQQEAFAADFSEREREHAEALTALDNATARVAAFEAGFRLRDKSDAVKRVIGTATGKATKKLAEARAALSALETDPANPKNPTTPFRRWKSAADWEGQVRRHLAAIGYPVGNVLPSQPRLSELAIYLVRLGLDKKAALKEIRAAARQWTPNPLETVPDVTRTWGTCWRAALKATAPKT